MPVVLGVQSGGCCCEALSAKQTSPGATPGMGSPCPSGGRAGRAGGQSDEEEERENGGTRRNPLRSSTWPWLVFAEEGGGQRTHQGVPTKRCCRGHRAGLQGQLCPRAADPMSPCPLCDAPAVTELASAKKHWPQLVRAAVGPAPNTPVCWSWRCLAYGCTR